MSSARGGNDAYAAIKAFVEVGGKFDDQQDANGTTAAMHAAFRGADAIRAFAEVGGKFTDQQNKYGETAAIYATRVGPSAINAFRTTVAVQKQIDSAPAHLPTPPRP